MDQKFSSWISHKDYSEISFETDCNEGWEFEYNIPELILITIKEDLLEKWNLLLNVLLFYICLHKKDEGVTKVIKYIEPFTHFPYFRDLERYLIRCKWNENDLDYDSNYFNEIVLTFFDNHDYHLRNELRRIQVYPFDVEVFNDFYLYRKYKHEENLDIYVN